MVGLLNEMAAKFEEDPPLSSKTMVDNKDPHELLAFVSNLQINDGTSSDAQRRQGRVSGRVSPQLLSFSGSVRQQDKTVNKVSVIGGGDLGMASVMSILSKVTHRLYIQVKWPGLGLDYNTTFTCGIFIHNAVFPFIFQCRVDKLVFIDVAESSTKGGSTDLEIFRLPNVEVSRGTSHSAMSHVSSETCHRPESPAVLLSEPIDDESRSAAAVTDGQLLSGVMWI